MSKSRFDLRILSDWRCVIVAVCVCVCWGQPLEVTSPRCKQSGNESSLGGCGSAHALAPRRYWHEFAVGVIIGGGHFFRVGGCYQINK